MEGSSLSSATRDKHAMLKGFVQIHIPNINDTHVALSRNPKSNNEAQCQKEAGYRSQIIRIEEARKEAHEPYGNINNQARSR